MIILHAAFIEQHLIVWGEDSAAGIGAEPQTKRRGRKPKNPPAASLPFGLDADGLLRALDMTGVAVDDAPQHHLVWLPTVEGLPCASSELIAPRPGGEGGFQMNPWQVSTLTVSSDAILDLLCLCHGSGLLVPGLMVGADLLFWGAALRFAGALVSLQQYLPSIAKEGDSVAARWQPVSAADDGARLARLSSAMNRSPVIRINSGQERRCQKTLGGRLPYRLSRQLYRKALAGSRFGRVLSYSRIA